MWLFWWSGNQVWYLNDCEVKFWQIKVLEILFFILRPYNTCWRRAVQRPGLQGAPVASLRTVPTRQIIFSNVSRSNKVNNPPHCDKNYLHEGKIFQSGVFAFLLSTLYLILLSLSLMFVLLHAFLIKFSLPRNSAAFSCCLFSINLIFLGAHCTRSPCPLSRLFTL